MRESEGETAGEKIPSGERGTKKNIAGWTLSVKSEVCKADNSTCVCVPLQNVRYNVLSNRSVRVHSYLTGGGFVSGS